MLTTAVLGQPGDEFASDPPSFRVAEAFQQPKRMRSVLDDQHRHFYSAATVRLAPGDVIEVD